MIVKYMNNDFSYYESIFADIIRRYVENAEEEFVQDMHLILGNMQEAINYVSLSITCIIIEFLL